MQKLKNIEEIDILNGSNMKRFGVHGIASIDLSNLDSSAIYRIVTDEAFELMKYDAIKKSFNESLYCWYNKGNINFGLMDKSKVKLGKNFKIQSDYDLFLFPSTEMNLKAYDARDEIIEDFIRHNFEGKKFNQKFEFNYNPVLREMQTMVIVSNSEIEMETMKKRLQLGYNI